MLRGGIYRVKKLLSIIGLTLLVAILVTGCSGAAISNEYEKAMKAAETYKLKEYTINEIPENPLTEKAIIQRIEEMEPFFADSFEEKPVNMSSILLALEATKTQQATLKPENMNFTVYQEEENYVDLDYTMDLLVEKKSGDSERASLEGRLTLVNKDGKWLIQADRIDLPAFLKLIPQK